MSTGSWNASMSTSSHSPSGNAAPCCGHCCSSMPAGIIRCFGVVVDVVTVVELDIVVGRGMCTQVVFHADPGAQLASCKVVPVFVFINVGAQRNGGNRGGGGVLPHNVLTLRSPSCAVPCRAVSFITLYITCAAHVIYLY